MSHVWPTPRMHSYVWRDSLTCVPWRFYVWLTHTLMSHVWPTRHMHSYVWRYSFTCVPWRCYVWLTHTLMSHVWPTRHTHSYVWRDSFTCVTWHKSRDLWMWFVIRDCTPTIFVIPYCFDLWVWFVCNVTHMSCGSERELSHAIFSDVWRDSFTRVTWRIYTRDVTQVSQMCWNYWREICGSCMSHVAHVNGSCWHCRS